jgi:chromosomal replication initiation ATPase DnaA
MPSQIALPLSLPGSGEASRIVIGNANQAAYEALTNLKGWPFNTAVLTGPERSGKSLLGKWAEGQGIAVIDGADSWDETELFHRWNKAQETGEPLLLISDSQPWEISLPDLRSRLGGSLQLEIGVPDDDMAARLIEAIAEQRGLALADGAVEYLVPRAERSFAGIERLVVAIDRLSLERKAPATMSLWRDALEAIRGPEQARLL